MTKLCSGQGNPDDDDTTDDTVTADESNPYMSPFQVTQKWPINCIKPGINNISTLCLNFDKHGPKLGQKN